VDAKCGTDDDVGELIQSFSFVVVRLHRES
jgi:hypothetical protein